MYLAHDSDLNNYADPPFRYCPSGGCADPIACGQAMSCGRCDSEDRADARRNGTFHELPICVPMVRLPPLDELGLNWWRVEPLLRRATQITGCYEPIDVLQLAMTGKVGIWFCGDLDAVIVTEVKQYPRRRVLEMMFCGGDNMASWLRDAIEVMDEHARHCGCSHIACVGRPGWERAWQGRRTGDVVMVRDLEGKADG